VAHPSNVRCRDQRGDLDILGSSTKAVLNTKGASSLGIARIGRRKAIKTGPVIREDRRKVIREDRRKAIKTGPVIREVRRKVIREARLKAIKVVHLKATKEARLKAIKEVRSNTTQDTSTKEAHNLNTKVVLNFKAKLTTREAPQASIHIRKYPNRSVENLY
jgi:hypothetical protein